LKDRDGKRLRYDKAYFIGEQDFYVPKGPDGRYLKFNSPAASMPQMLEAMKTNEPRIGRPAFNFELNRRADTGHCCENRS